MHLPVLQKSSPEGISLLMIEMKTSHIESGVVSERSEVMFGDLLNHFQAVPGNEIANVKRRSVWGGVT